MTIHDVIVGLIVGLAVGTAIGIVIADVFWGAARWRTATKDTLRAAREHRRKRLQAEAKSEFYRLLWLEAVGAAPPADDRHSRKATGLALVEKAGV